MLISAKKVVGLPIVEAVGLKKIGSIRDIIVDPDTGVILGFIIRIKRISLNKKIVSMKDAREIFANGVVVNSIDALVDSREVYRIESILKRNISFLHNKVYTQNNVYLGNLEDFIFDKDLSKVVSLFVKKPFSGETRIIDASRILSILPDKIIVRDITSPRVYDMNYQMGARAPINV